MIGALGVRLVGLHSCFQAAPLPANFLESYGRQCKILNGDVSTGDQRR
jgi:hypothetical protein